jgi:hypothetical protein
LVDQVANRLVEMMQAKAPAQEQQLPGEELSIEERVDG